jgi:hypothetical protein
MLTASYYNSTSMPVLGYLSQLLEVPLVLLRKEAHVLHKFLHLPGNALDLNWIFNLNVLGGPCFFSIAVYNSAVLSRTAVKTIPAWREYVELLVSAAEEFVLILRLLDNKYWGTL